MISHVLVKVKMQLGVATLGVVLATLEMMRTSTKFKKRDIFPFCGLRGEEEGWERNECENYLAKCDSVKQPRFVIYRTGPAAKTTTVICANVRI